MSVPTDAKTTRQVRSAGQPLPSSGIVFYEGSWRSLVYPSLIAHGSVAAEVNYDTKTAKILLRYEGAFLRGTTKQLETSITMKETSAAAHAQTSTYVFSIKGAGAQNQTLTFSASSITISDIVGTYKSYSPSDKGTYEMKAITKAAFEEFAQKSGACTIM